MPEINSPDDLIGIFTVYRGIISNLLKRKTANLNILPGLKVFDACKNSFIKQVWL